MSIVSVIKKLLKKTREIGKGLYRVFYAFPVTAYKKHICPAINEFKVDTSQSYTFDSFYPAIMRKNPKKAERIYKRVVSFDENSLPMLSLYEQKYWPVTIVQYGLLNYNFFLTYKEEQYKSRFLNVCDWLVRNISDSGIWEHYIRYHCLVVDEMIDPPYGSAMVQGEAISALVRGFQLTHNSEYLLCAEKALQPFQVHVSAGGVLDYFLGLPFYEEYPTKTPSLVLNGFMFSLFGLYDLSCTESEKSGVAKQLFHDGIHTLETVLPMYEGGYCSRYDLSHITAAPKSGLKNPFYHPIHVNQLIALQTIHHSPVFAYYIKEWK